MNLVHSTWYAPSTLLYTKCIPVQSSNPQDNNATHRTPRNSPYPAHSTHQPPTHRRTHQNLAQPGPRQRLRSPTHSREPCNNQRQRPHRGLQTRQHRQRSCKTRSDSTIPTNYGFLLASTFVYKGKLSCLVAVCRRFLWSRLGIGLSRLRIGGPLSLMLFDGRELKC